MLVELVDILAGDDVDLRVPVMVEGVEGLQLFLLPPRQLREIFLNDLCFHHVSKVII